MIAPPQMPAAGKGSRGPLPMCVGRGVRAWGPGAVDMACLPCGGPCAAGIAMEGLPSRISHRCEGRLVSGAFPLPGGGQAPLAVCPGRGWCGCGDPAPAPQRAFRRASFACCGGGGRASPGCPPGRDLALWRGALVLPLLRYPRPLAGSRGPLPMCGGRGRAGVGPGTVPLACMPCGGLRAMGMLGGRPRGDDLSPL